MKKPKIRSAVQLLFTALVALIVCMALGWYAWEKYFIGEQIYKADLKLIDHADIADTYDLVIGEGDRITGWEKHTFRDSMTYYVLYIIVRDREGFFADNDELISHMELVNSMNVDRRELLTPYLFYKNKTAAIVTADVRNGKLNNDGFGQAYSDIVARSFDDHISTVQQGK